LAGRIAEDTNLAETGLVLLAPAGGPAGALKQPFVAKAGKPVRQSNLYNAIITAANGHLGRIAHDHAPAEPGAAKSAVVRILVAEDNDINQTLITEILTFMGHQFQCVGTGKAAVAELKNQPYDLVLMDCQMPEMDGYEATRQVRAHFQPAHGPVIVAMTANAMEGDRERCLAAGMDDYLAKPLLLEPLAACIDRWAGQVEQTRAARPTANAEAQ
jgi:CheY-like chemotaxis protein